jgi:hypothetical protein
MVDEGDLAAALIAKLTSNDLGMVDQFTERRQSSGAANRLDPMAFVQKTRQVNNFVPQQSPVSEQQQQAILEQANRMAEQLHPLPVPQPVMPPAPMPSLTSSLGSTESLERKLENIHIDLEKINNTLEKLVEVFNVKNEQANS